MRFLGMNIHFGGATTLDDIEQADAQYNTLFATQQTDEADALAERMHRNGFTPHYDRENKAFYFVEAQELVWCSLCGYSHMGPACDED